jgi:serine/threonine protein kinase
MVRPGDRIGEYVLDSRIGSGAFGEVWRASHHVLNRKVAIKVSHDPEFVTELRNAGTIQAHLEHPGIVRTLGLDPQHTPPYLVMELVNGESLRELLERRGVLGFDEAFGIAVQILRALEYAHAHGVVHRDLKPENIILVRTEDAAIPEVKITDFGLGCVAEMVKSSLILSGDRTVSDGKRVIGTIDYMAPEQKRGQGMSDPRIDIYACGVIVYEMLMGRIPEGAFQYPSEREPQVPKVFDTVLARCLALDTRDRFSNVTDILKQLETLGEGPEELRGPTPDIQDRFLFINGREAGSLLELIQIADQDRNDGKYHLYNGDFEVWLRRIRQKSLSRVAMNIRETQVDRDVGLEMFIEESGLLAMPRPELDTRSIDAGMLVRGQTRDVKFFVNNYSRGMFWGTAEVIEGAEWLGLIAPAAESGRPASSIPIKGKDACIRARVNSASLASDRSHRGVIRIDTQAGTMTATVTVAVEPKPGRVRMEPDTLDVFYTDGQPPKQMEISFRNVGDLPTEIALQSSHPCIEIEESELTVSDTEVVTVTFRPDRVTRKELRPGKYGTRFIQPIVEISGNVERKKLPIPVYYCPGRNWGTIFLGALMGVIPVFGEIVALITISWLMIMKIRGVELTPSGAKDVEPFIQLRSGISFLIGTLLGCAGHVILLMMVQ